MDRNLESKLALELSGIFNWALEGYKRLRKNGFQLKDVPSLKLAKQRYKNETDSVRAFAGETLRKSSNPTDRSKFSEVYGKYVSYCQSEGNEIQKKSEFKKVLEELGFEIRNSSKDRNQVCIFQCEPNQEN